MKKAMRAVQPGDKIYNLERIHSKLVHLSTIEEMFQHKLSNGAFAIDEAFLALIDNLNCINEFGDSKLFKNYKSSLSQALSITQKFREINPKEIKESYCTAHGDFARFKRMFKGSFKELCELEYQNVIVPLFELDQIYIKQRRLSKYS